MTKNLLLHLRIFIDFFYFFFTKLTIHSFLFNPSYFGLPDVREPNLPTGHMNFPRDSLEKEELATDVQYANIVKVSNKHNMCKHLIEPIPLERRRLYKMKL